LRRARFDEIDEGLELADPGRIAAAVGDDDNTILVHLHRIISMRA
jgi:hypothetical protein